MRLDNLAEEPLAERLRQDRPPAAVRLRAARWDGNANPPILVYADLDLPCPKCGAPPAWRVAYHRGRNARGTMDLCARHGLNWGADEHLHVSCPTCHFEYVCLPLDALPESGSAQ